MTSRLSSQTNTTAKLAKAPIHEVLDCYHAAHHISLALAARRLDDKKRMPLYREYRTLLRNGQWRRVVEELTDVPIDEPKDSKVWTETNYLQKYGDAGRLKNPTFKSLGLPLGRAVIESNIRRVMNMRMKGNSIYWSEEVGAGTLQIRAQVLTNRRDEQLVEPRQLQSRDGRTDGRWVPQAMSSKAECVADSTASFEALQQERIRQNANSPVLYRMGALRKRYRYVPLAGAIGAIHPHRNFRPADECVSHAAFPTRRSLCGRAGPPGPRNHGDQEKHGIRRRDLTLNLSG